MTQEFPLEPSPTEMRRLAEAAISFVIDHIGGLPDAPAAGTGGGDDLAATFREALPERGAPFEDLLPRFDAAVARSFNAAAPGYLAFIPGGGLTTAAIADLLAAATNRYVGLWSASPALAQIEWTAIRWLADMVAYPPEARGILTSGGSLATLSAIVTARRALLGDAFSDGVLYGTVHTHASVQKAAIVAGFSPANIRRIDTTPDLEMDVDALARAVAEDRATGLRPFLVIASAGTTNTGAVDPLPEIMDLADAEGLWVHADAAYGGFFVLTERGRAAMPGLERAHSITLDPHKGMFMPYGLGALLVRDGAALRAAHSTGDAAGYLQDLATAESWDFNDYSPELTRPFRGLRIWLALKLHGLAAFRDALDEKLDLTQQLTEGLKSCPAIEIPWHPRLSVVAFRLRDAGADANRALLARINASQRIFLSSTMIDGRFTLRACIVSHRTHADRITEAIDIITAAAAAS